MVVKFIRDDKDDRQSRSDNELEEAPVQNSLDSWFHCIRGVGQTFKDAAKFRIYMKKYSVAIRHSFLYAKNDRDKIIVVCTEHSCKWRVYASRHKADNLFGIKKCNLQHTCGEDNLSGRGHPRADSAWVADLMKNKLRGEPSYRPCAMVKDVHIDFGVDLEYHKAWKGKELAMHDLHGTDKGCYDKLRWYCREVRETNPGSVADCEIDVVTNKFKRLFLCFNACAVGFATGCRPIIFLDGTHIKNKYKCSILLAVAKDANDDLFTLAYAVVDAENDSNWEWFCFHLRGVLVLQHIMVFEKFTFFSDRNPGIIKAVKLLFPGSHHAYCLRHLMDNFVKQVLRSYPLHNKKHWSSVFKKAAYAPSQQEFTRHINNILKSMPRASTFITSSDPQSWANVLFPGRRWGVINNNISECWNNWVKPARHLSIVSMVDHVRVQIMNMMHRRRETTSVMVQELSPKKEKALATTYIESRNLSINKSCGWKFEVVDGDKSFAVDLNEWTCSCKSWQINMLPCKHACAAIKSKSMSLYVFCDRYFHIEMYRQAYKGMTNPIPTFDMYETNNDEGSVINAPDIRSQPGRRRTKRIPSQVETHVSKCGRCHKPVHNRRSCKEAIE
ncbi:uncharacterized protein [Henckelia pumila]|uniref:uncharacterized protein n=1 Tax=Henckelia pumila TaxID=405737 RepID=UPI003C6E5FD7